MLHLRSGTDSEEAFMLILLLLSGRPSGRPKQRGMRSIRPYSRRGIVTAAVLKLSLTEHG